jgi:hypothetical protein
VTRFLLRHERLLRLVHRVTHARTPRDKPCRLCDATWSYFETLPAFNEALREAEADFDAGRFVLFRAEDMKR